MRPAPRVDFPVNKTSFWQSPVGFGEFFVGELFFLRAKWGGQICIWIYTYHTMMIVWYNMCTCIHTRVYICIYNIHMHKHSAKFIYVPFISIVRWTKTLQVIQRICHKTNRPRWWMVEMGKLPCTTSGSRTMWGFIAELLGSVESTSWLWCMISIMEVSPTFTRTEGRCPCSLEVFSRSEQWRRAPGYLL